MLSFDLRPFRKGLATSVGLTLSAVLAACLVGPSTFLGASVRDAQKEKPCATNLATCTPNGCSTNAEPLHQLFNRTKHTPPPAAGAAFVQLELGDFETLQELVDEEGMPQGRGSDLTQAQRNTLKTIATINGTTVGEGTFVQLERFLTNHPSNPRANTGESVNLEVESSPMLR